MQVRARALATKTVLYAVALQTMLISIINKLLGNLLRDLHCLPYKTRGQSVPARTTTTHVCRSNHTVESRQRIDRVRVRM